MTPFEYLLMFAAVILGLAVSELAIKCHRLTAHGTPVRWDWLSPLAAFVVLLKIITQWWSWYGAQLLPGGLRFEMFIVVVIGAVLLFLLAAVALPETGHADGVDLRQYYETTRRRFWLLFAAHWALATALSIWAEVVVGGAIYSGLSFTYLVVPVSVAMAFIRYRWMHGLVLAALAVVYTAQFFGQQLASR